MASKHGVEPAVRSLEESLSPVPHESNEWSPSSGMTESSKKLIRNGSADFLIVTGQAGERVIKARYEGETASHTVERGGQE